MNRGSFCEWTPILPLPVWPLAGQFLLGQKVVVGSMTLLLAVRGHIATRSMSGPPFALQLHRTTVWCGATPYAGIYRKRIKTGHSARDATISFGKASMIEGKDGAICASSNASTAWMKKN